MMRKKKKLGLAFQYQLTRVRTSSKHQSQGENSWEDILLPNYTSEDVHKTANSWRILATTMVFIFIFFALFLRLFHLQVVSGDEYRLMADTNRIQIKVIHAPRGVIYDRNGRVLAENNPGFRLKDKFISRDEALNLEAQNDPSYNDLEIDTIRTYPYGDIASDILGYVGQISEDELKDPNDSDYKIGDRIGRAGIEEAYESDLRGKDGAEVIEVDAQGRKVRTIRTIDPVPGKNIYLSIDIDLQKQTFEALKKGLINGEHSCCGAAVVEDPNNGEVLALVSLPAYDANAFTDPSKNDLVQTYFSDPNAPLLNRAISGVYPPGSTFKITSTLAGLESGKITKDTKIDDTGVISLGPYKFSNWYFSQYGKVEGMVDVVKALQRSNDTFYYELGATIGEQALAQAAESLSMGSKLGIDIPGEASGLIPTDQWKRQNIGEDWYPGDTLHFAIGQGYLLTTPLQIAGEMAFIADNGVLQHPHLVTKIDYPDGKLYKQNQFDPLVKNAYNQSYIDLVKQGLSLVPKQGGTAWPFFNFSIPTAGKTGTAEYGDPNNKTHAWYTAYAPLNDPKIVATVLVEGGGEGSNVAAPVVKDIFTWYFNPDKNNIRSLDVAPVATASAKLLGE